MRRGFDLTRMPNADCDVGEGVTFDESVCWGRGVRVGRGTHLGPNVTLHDGVELGEGCWVGPGSVLGEPTMGFFKDRDAYRAAPTRVGANSILRVGAIINAGTTVGENFQTGPNVAIRERTVIGRNVSVGNNCDIQHDVEVGDFVRLHSFVTVGSGTRIGPYVWAHPFVIFTNDRLFPVFSVPEPPVIAPFTVLAVSCTVLPGARLGVHVVAGANSEIGGAVPSFSLVKGCPAERVIDARRMLHKIDGKVHQPYPWIKHIDRDYPWRDVPPEERRVEDWVPDAWKEYL